jgi:hypothetical protein
MRITLVLLVATVVLAFAACEDANPDASGPSDSCTPNATAPCYCIAGGSGVKFCKEDGSGYGVCQRTQQAEVPVECTPTDEYAYKGCFENDIFYFDNCDAPALFIQQCADGTNCRDGECTSDCEAEYVTVCRGSEVVYQDSCGVDGEVVSVCGSGSECKGGNCMEACIDASCVAGTSAECTCSDGSAGTQTCTGNAWGTCVCVPVDEPDTHECVPINPQVEKVCSGSAVVWVDDCGDQGEQVTPCAIGCTNGVCDTDDECSPAHFEKDCHQSDIWWFDSCGNPSDAFEGCGDGYCADAECVEACTPHDTKECVAGDIFWLDSCGKQESMFMDCDETEFCVNLSCVKGSYKGDWWMQPQNPAQNPNFLQGVWSIDEDEETGAITLTDNSGPFAVNYIGTVEGKVVKGDASYDYQGMDIEASIFLNFSSPPESTGVQPPTEFTGTLQETATLDGLLLSNTVTPVKGCRGTQPCP